MKEVELSQGKVAIVDDGDYLHLSRLKWHYNNVGYAVHTVHTGRKSEGKWITEKVLMHRFIMQPSKGLVVDHINHDTLDNRRSNLRICTYAQNAWNSTLQDKNISWFAPAKLWRFRIIANKRETIKYFKTRAEALDYKVKNIHLYHGEFAGS